MTQRFTVTSIQADAIVGVMPLNCNPGIAGELRLADDSFMFSNLGEA